MLADNYAADESICNFGISYSGAGLVISRGVKVSNSSDDAYISSMDSYAVKPAAFKLDDSGDILFLNTDTSATTTTDNPVTLYERLRIDSKGNLKQGTSTNNAFTGSSPNTAQRFLSPKCMQGCVTDTTTLDNNGDGTFDLGKLWITDDTSIEMFIQVVRNDTGNYTTHYAKAFINKVRGTGMSQGHILYQNGAASGFSLSAPTSGGYTGTGGSSHGTQISCSGGAGGVIYRLTCFYTSISKNDMY